MEFNVIAEVLKCEEFESKDKSKKFYNISLLVGDLVIPFKFCKETHYSTCKAVGRLGQVDCKLIANVSGIIDGNNAYDFRLLDIKVYKKGA